VGGCGGGCGGTTGSGPTGSGTSPRNDLSGRISANR